MELLRLAPQHPKIVGSFGHLNDLISYDIQQVRDECDIVEIRLDLMLQQGWQFDQTPWAGLKNAGVPLLFTARCSSEGGAGQLTNHDREKLLLNVSTDAALIDIELVNAREMAALRQHCHLNSIPWVASFHDFTRLPEIPSLDSKIIESQQLGASAFKVAATLIETSEMVSLESFQFNQRDFPVSSMGMGLLALESRIRCGIAGSVLNYGYLGSSATAPGQCGANDLREQILQRRQLSKQ